MLICDPGHLCPPFGKTGQIFSDLIAALLRSWQAVVFLFFVLDTLLMWTLVAPNISACIDISNVEDVLIAQEDQRLRKVLCRQKLHPPHSFPAHLPSFQHISDSLRGHGWWDWINKDLMCADVSVRKAWDVRPGHFTHFKRVEWEKQKHECSLKMCCIPVLSSWCSLLMS